PNAGPGAIPNGTAHLVVREDGLVIGHVVVNPFRGVAGIYEMGVIESRRRQGIGRELLLGALQWAFDRGCRAAVLNATADGEALYRTLGFASLGLGQTWWLAAGGRVPVEREVMLARAIGMGDVATLAALRPSRDELVAPLPSGTSPLRLAVIAD